MLQCKKICLSVVLINQINHQDNGLTVRTPFQILVNYIFSKIMSSNHKQNGLECNPMRTTSTPHMVAHPSVSCTIAESRVLRHRELVLQVSSEPQAQLLIAGSSAD